MNAIKKAQNYIAKDPYRESAKTLAQLVLTLESREPFPLEKLYELDMERFNRVMEHGSMLESDAPEEVLIHHEEEEEEAAVPV